MDLSSLDCPLNPEVSHRKVYQQASQLHHSKLRQQASIYVSNLARSADGKTSICMKRIACRTVSSI